MKKWQSISLISGITIFGVSIIITSIIIAKELNFKNKSESNFKNYYIAMGGPDDSNSEIHWYKSNEISSYAITTIEYQHKCWYYSYFVSYLFCTEFATGDNTPTPESNWTNFNIDHIGIYLLLSNEDYVLVW